MKSERKYVELHLHTAFSFLDGASLPEEMIARASELGYHALAVTDHDGLYGSMEFAQHAQSAGIAPLTGAELTLTDGSHLTLLAESARGYANLCRLITAAHHNGLPPIDEAAEPEEPIPLWRFAPPPPLCLPPNLGERTVPTGGSLPFS